MRIWAAVSGGPLYEREVDFHLINHEFARTAEDILWRRSKKGFRVRQSGAGSGVRLANR